MKILQVHNRYNNYGGEDAVVDNEYQLLINNKFEVEQLFFDNHNLSLTDLFYNKEAYDVVNRKIKEFQPMVVHVHNMFYKASPSVFKAAKDNGVPTVLTLHNFRLLCPGALFLRNSNVCLKCKNSIFPIYGVVHKCFQDSYIKSLVLSSFLALNSVNKTWDKLIDKIIVLTPFIKQLFSESSLDYLEYKLIVKPNSTDDFLLKNSLKSENKFLFVGRLSDEKGVSVLIKAFNQMPGLKLDVIGTGELEDELKKEAEDNIIFHGLRDKAFIKEKLNSSRALIFPSIWYEGLPNTIIEAFSAGTPVIISNIENLNQIVLPNYNGIIFTPNNVDDLVRKVLEFKNQNTRHLEKNARVSFEKKYNHTQNFENLKNIYSQLVE